MGVWGIGEWVYESMGVLGHECMTVWIIGAWVHRVLVVWGIEAWVYGRM